MAGLPPRNLQTEVRKHFRGTPEERILTCLRLGHEALDLFLASLPEGTSREEARAVMQRNKNHGRRHSAVMERRFR